MPGIFRNGWERNPRIPLFPRSALPVRMNEGGPKPPPNAVRKESGNLSPHSSWRLWGDSGFPDRPEKKVDPFDGATRERKAVFSADRGFPGIDPDERCSLGFPEEADGGNSRSRPDLDDDGSADPLPPMPEMLFLGEGSPIVPSIVPEHQDAGAGQGPAVGADRKGGEESSRSCVDLGIDPVRTPEEVPAVVETLQHVDRAVAF